VLSAGSILNTNMLRSIEKLGEANTINEKVYIVTS
jgi:hypothetical protein